MIISNKLGIFIIKHANAQLSVSGQKEIQKLPEKSIFKAVISDKVVIPKKVLNSTQVFNSCFVDDIKDPCTNKADQKRHQIVYFYNYEKKNLVLIYSLKIQVVSQGINFCLTAIIQNNNNNNITFYLWDIMQTYIEIALDILNFYIRPFSELISSPNTSFDSIVKVIRVLYCKPKVDKYWFTIYYLYYKK